MSFSTTLLSQLPKSTRVPFPESPSNNAFVFSRCEQFVYNGKIKKPSSILRGVAASFIRHTEHRHSQNFYKPILIKNRKMHHPGIEPGSPRWQRSILPLDQ